jgi:hypothetical protein
VVYRSLHDPLTGFSLYHARARPMSNHGDLARTSNNSELRLILDEAEFIEDYTWV